jgi:hypothetical protein
MPTLQSLHTVILVDSGQSMGHTCCKKSASTRIGVWLSLVCVLYKGKHLVVLGFRIVLMGAKKWLFQNWPRTRWKHQPKCPNQDQNPSVCCVPVARPILNEKSTTVLHQTKRPIVSHTHKYINERYGEFKLDEIGLVLWTHKVKQVCRPRDTQ